MAETTTTRASIGAKELVLGMAAGIREAIGTFPKPGVLDKAMTMLECQVRALSGPVPGILRASGEAALARLQAIVPDAELREKLAHDAADPSHAFYILIFPEHALRRKAAKLAQGCTCPACSGSAMGIIAQIVRREDKDGSDD